MFERKSILALFLEMNPSNISELSQNTFYCGVQKYLVLNKDEFKFIKADKYRLFKDYFIIKLKG